MDKDIILKKELKGFNINIDDIEPNDNILGALEEAIIRMRNEYLINRLEVVLNDNLIEVKDKITNYRTLFGARISYDNLSKDISFIVRKDNKPSYEQLEQQVKKQKEVINKIMNLIKQYGKYDGKKCTRGFQMWSADFNKLLDMLKEVSE